MSIFTALMNKIMGFASEATSGAQHGSPVENTSQQSQGASATSNSPAAGTVSPLQKVEIKNVDVQQVLDKMSKDSTERLNWKTSIVDLLKLVKIDSSLSSRKELASELQYSGDKNDSAAMNMWLHKEVMKKLSENGGKVPAELLL